MGAGEVDIVDGPRLESRPEVPTLGIRETVPFRTMLSNRDRLLAELVEWLTEHEIEPAGHFFLRLHVVNMADLVDIEVGVVAVNSASDARVHAGSLPAGDYALLAYRTQSMAANRLLHAWVREQDLALDAHAVPTGEAFASRCEIYLTDPRTEKRKTRWGVELAFLTRR
ncbi:GyrI-like domain-containing protein [Microbacterium sp. 2FI]|uniref:GyrI-like domain-containing protein n=1 Tax=Microbacterium sp. 2FI TaxID=2502193 RepID=UPI0010F9A724|nr:GyrI-like domain-containing protein [Microbacterium sp. 2FI]